MALLWVIAGGILWGLRVSRPTPEKVIARLETRPLGQTDRADQITWVVNQVNGLDFANRQKLVRSPVMRQFYTSLTPEEQKDYLSRTMPEGFRQIMIALNRMTPEKRKQVLERASENLRKMQAEEGTERDRPPVDDETMRKIVAQGMTSFYEEANAEVKLDCAPLIEQIQQTLQWRN